MRWLAPSVGAASAGAVAAGGFEGAAAGDPLGIAATVGFVVLLALPVLLAVGAIARALVEAWQPRARVAAATDDDGGAPRLAAWVAVAWLGVAGLYWASFQGTWLLAAWTAFKPLPVAFAEPVIAIVAALLAILLARPVARFLAFLARAIDRRWRRDGRRASLVTPRKVLVGTAVVTVAVVGVLWIVVIRPHIGPVDLGLLRAPLVGIAVAGAYHAVPGRAVLGYLAGGLAAIAIGVAVYARLAEPALVLEIWGNRPLAGLAIDGLCDLDAIRGDLPLAAFRPTPVPGAAHPDIVLVTIDTVRADHTPPYGGQAVMPLLREMAAKGVTFEWAFSPSNVSRRSIPSMVTGLAPDRVHGRVVGWALRLDPRHVVLAERLAAAGYETAGFLCCAGIWGADAHTGLQRGLEHLVIEASGPVLGKAARDWIAAREAHPTTRPLFVWLHVLEPHNWIAAPPEPRTDDERRRAYDRALGVADAAANQLLAGFGPRPPERAPLVIVTSDHGEGLGEHGQPYHATDLYDSQIRVPLVMAGPSIHPGRVGETVSLTDLVPTILELAGYAAPQDGSLDGRSLADLATGKRVSAPDAGVAFAAMIPDRADPGGLVAIIRGQWKLLDADGHEELYNLHADPDERTSLINQTGMMRIVGELRQALKAHDERGKRSPFR